MNNQVKIILLLLSTSTTANRTSLGPIPKDCKDGHAYESLEKCQQCCLTSNDHSKCPKQLARSIYKSLHLQEDEFIISNGTLFLRKWLRTLNASKFDQYFYSQPNKTAIVCYPLRHSFHDCPKVRRWLGKIYDDKTAYTRHLDANFTIDNYKLSYSPSIRLIICSDPYMESVILSKQIGNVLTAISLLISFIFVIKTFDRRKNFALICYLGMYFIAALIQAEELLFRWPDTRFPRYRNIVCPTIAFIEQYCHISHYLWMNVHVFAIHSAITKFEIQKREFKLKKILCACVYGWGIPLVYCVLTYFLEKMKVGFLKLRILDICWVKATFIHVSGPACVSLIVNLILFAHILIRARKIIRDVADVNADATRQMFVVATKLFMVIGFCYVFDFVVGVTEKYVGVWFALTIVPTYQGVFVLIALVCSARTFNSVERLCKTKMRKQNSEEIANLHRKVSTITNQSRF